ncbi:MAG: MoxR family ATPase [Desulfurococcales archaeon]|nr:MoxR family ATPase [Desulfurococcales archaeon]
MPTENNVISDILGKVIDEVSKSVVGKREEIELMTATLVAGGHILVEGPPGAGKTFSCKSLAKAFGGSYRRIQGNPDVLPSDIMGFYVYTIGGERRFIRGPVFSNILQVDDVNRIPSRALSALLQAMTEYSVSIEGDTYKIEKPFHVFATMIPSEIEVGTFKLPLGLIDRFWIYLNTNYVRGDVEAEIVNRADELYETSTEKIRTILSPEELRNIQDNLGEMVYSDKRIVNYIVNVVNNLRDHPDIIVGPSNRGSIYFYRLSKAYALIKGRDYVIPDDAKYLARYVLPHRVLVRPTSSKTPMEIIEEVLSNTPVPKE